MIVALSFLALANAAVLPPLNGCGVPPCTNTTVHYPHIEPGFFWQCAPEAGCDTWKAVKMPCAPGLWFSYKEQACARCSEWENPCGLNPAPECECEVPTTTDGFTTAEIPEVPPGNCEPPTCYKTEILFPHKDPTKFWQCAPVAGCDDWEAVEKVCPAPLYFSWKHQVCVWDCDWENVCNVPTPTNPPTTPAPTTPAPTTPAPTTEAPTTIEITEPPPPGNCEPPHCTNTTRLYPHIDQRFFWQCAPEFGCDAWKPVKMPCPPGLWFSNKHQVCVYCSEWENPCNLNPAPECECVEPTQGPTTEKPTTIEITEPPPPGNCEAPNPCFNTTTLFAHKNPTKFWQCAPVAGCDEWEAVEKQCPSPLFFSQK